MISKKDLADRIERFFNSLEKDNTKQQAQIAETKQENLTLKKQLQCAAKGHNFVFDKVEHCYWISSPSTLSLVRENAHKYLFKCSNCNLIITKTKDELTLKEIKALRGLGILEGKSDKNNKRS